MSTRTVSISGLPLFQARSGAGAEAARIQSPVNCSAGCRQSTPAYASNARATIGRPPLPVAAHSEHKVTNLCAICDVAIGADNNTAEHIIPQSIGGRRTVSGFICRDCNSAAGLTWDKELFRQLHWFTVMLGIARPKGPAPDINVETASGNRYAVSATGAMTPAELLVERSEDGKSFRIRARDLEEAKRLLIQIHKRYPTFDLAEVLATMEFSNTKNQEVMKTSFEFGGALAGRSMVKTAVALAHSLGVPPGACDRAVAYLKEAPGVEPSLAEHFTSDVVTNRPARLFNCIVVQSDAEKRRLVGYVEYFGVCRWIIHLSTDYAGPEVSGRYCFDAITGEETPLEVNLSMTDSDFQASLDNLTGDHTRRLNAYNGMIGLLPV